MSKSKCKNCPITTADCNNLSRITCGTNNFCTWSGVSEYGTCFMKDAVKDNCKDCMIEANIDVMKLIRKNPVATICACVGIGIFVLILIIIAGTFMGIKLLK